eukprot:6178779-Pleurochrysis_carterae.AAC.1
MLLGSDQTAVREVATICIWQGTDMKPARPSFAVYTAGLEVGQWQQDVPRAHPHRSGRIHGARGVCSTHRLFNQPNSLVWPGRRRQRVEGPLDLVTTTAGRLLKDLIRDAD